MDRRRRTMTLWEQLTTPDPAIRDLLKIPHDDEGGRGDAERRPCTLMEAIGRESRGESGGGMIIWKPLRLRDRLRLRRAANARSATTSNRRADENGSEEEEEENKAPAAASMSLMALLEQADSQWDDEEDDANASQRGAVAGQDIEDDGEGREEEEEEDMVRACCVCMVRHKGAAFIPCGHTFCRLCSRDLWLTRANCPICNAFIHDILHIF